MNMDVTWILNLLAIFDKIEYEFESVLNIKQILLVMIIFLKEK